MDKFSVIDIIEFLKSLDTIIKMCEQIQIDLTDIERENEIRNVVNSEAVRHIESLLQKYEEYRNELFQSPPEAPVLEGENNAENHTHSS